MDDLGPYVDSAMMVAGGCIRDWRYGLAPKDIDVFMGIPSEDGWLGESLAGELNHLPQFKVKVEDLTDNTLAEYEEWSEGNLHGQLTGTWFAGDAALPINLILRRDIKDDATCIVPNFDMGICQGFFLPDGDYPDFTQAARYDLRTRQATIMSQTQAKRARQRFDRFNKRHPGLVTLVDPYKD